MNDSECDLDLSPLTEWEKSMIDDCECAELDLADPADLDDC